MEVRLGPSKSYKMLAISAARKAELSLPDTDDVDKLTSWIASDPDARSLRNQAWLEYEERIRDDRTYTLRAVAEWLKTEYDIDLSISSIDRDRHRINRKEDAAKMSNQRMSAAMKLIHDSHSEDMFGDGLAFCAQTVLSQLMNFDLTTLTEMEPKDVVALMKLMPQISNAAARNLESRAKLTKLREKLDAEAKAKTAGGKSATFTSEEIFMAMDDVMKGDAQ